MVLQHAMRAFTALDIDRVVADNELKSLHSQAFKVALAKNLIKLLFVVLQSTPQHV